MSDTYQAIYDAARSRIINGDVGSAIRDVAMQQFDISFLQQHAQQALYQVANEWQRPSVLYRPEISADGNMWCALLGDNLQVGVAGFGKTPAEAMAAFDMEFWKGETPASAIEARRAATTKIDAVHESAVPNGETPND